MAATAKISFLNRDSLPVCLSSENPYGLVSLWDMLNYFDAYKFGSLISTLSGIQSLLISREGDDLNDEFITLMQGDITQVYDYCKLHGFSAAAEITSRALAHLKYDSLNPSSANAEVRHVEEAFLSDAKSLKFVSIPLERTKYVTIEQPFGQQVHDNFPSARFDLSEAGNCLACGSYTATGFHLMRVAEIGLWELGKDRQITFAKNNKIEFTAWGLIIAELVKSVEAITQWPNSPTKEDAHKFYNTVVVEIRAFNDGWRRHLAHVRKMQQPLLDKEAMALWAHVERFMMTLATKISEGRYMPFIW